MSEIFGSFVPISRAISERFPGAHDPGRERFERLARFVLSNEYAEKVQEVWDATLEIWRDEEASVAFLLRKHPMIDDLAPLEAVFEKEDGVRIVKDILLKLKYGSVA